MRLTPDQAVGLGLLTADEAARMKRDNLEKKRRRRAGAVPAASPSAGAAKAPRQPGSDPQIILFEALCERLPGLPELEKQGLVPGRRFRADIFIAPDIIVEFDGFRYHSSKSAFQKDRERENLMVAHGYRVFRAYAKQVFDTDARAGLVDLIVGFAQRNVEARQ